MSSKMKAKRIGGGTVLERWTVDRVVIESDGIARAEVSDEVEDGSIPLTETDAVALADYVGREVYAEINFYDRDPRKQ